MGAIKHHFIDRDATLLRMLGRSPHHTMQDPQGASHD
jgi:cytochrome b561